MNKGPPPHKTIRRFISRIFAGGREWHDNTQSAGEKKQTANQNTLLRKKNKSVTMCGDGYYLDLLW